MKVVGRRSVQVGEAAATAWQRSVSHMIEGRGACERGVFRFVTFEEAQAWMTRQVAQSAHEYRRTRTSRE